MQSETPIGIIKNFRLIIKQLEELEHFNDNVKKQLEVTAQRLDDLESKIISVNENYYTIAGYCNLKSISCPLHLAKEWRKQTTVSLSRQRDIATGTAHEE